MGRPCGSPRSSRLQSALHPDGCICGINQSVRSLQPAIYKALVLYSVLLACRYSPRRNRIVARKITFFGRHPSGYSVISIVVVQCRGKQCPPLKEPLESWDTTSTILVNYWHSIDIQNINSQIAIYENPQRHEKEKRQEIKNEKQQISKQTGIH